MSLTQSLVEQIYEQLLREILAGEFPPGVPLREGELASRLGVSRTPVREAISRLSAYGVVEARPNRSAVVRRLTWADPGYIHQMREALEGMAAEQACGRLSTADFARLDTLSQAASDPEAPDFFAAFDAHDVTLHRLIASRAGNPLLAREVRRLQDLTLLVQNQLESVQLANQRIVDADRKRIRRIAWKQHAEIVEALRAGNGTDSRRAMVDHLRFSCDHLTRFMPDPHC